MPDRHGESLDRVGDELERSAQAIDLGPVLDERGQLVELLSCIVDVGERATERELDRVTRVVEPAIIVHVRLPLGFGRGSYTSVIRESDTAKIPAENPPPIVTQITVDRAPIGSSS